MFVQKYFNDLNLNRKKLNEKELGVINTQNGWKVKVLLVNEQNILLIGKKGRNQMSKKYLYQKVR